jgi:peptide/nickel transport system permease protein
VIRYVIRRLLWAGVLFVAVTIVSYVIFFIIPADPAKLVAGKAARPIDVQRAAHFLGTDKPVYQQYLRFLGRLLPVYVSFKDNGRYFNVTHPPHIVAHAPSLGFSFATRTEVNKIIKSAAPVTFSLVIGGVVVWMLIALPLGILSALRPRSALDRTGMVFVLIGISAHPVWIGLILSYIFGYKLGWTPITGYCSILNPPPGATCAGPVQWAYHMILPWITYAILFAALYVRMIRANVTETLGEDYVRTARAKGAPESRVLRSHVLRNAMLPVVTMLGMDIAVGLGGAVFTESIYGLPGLGRQLIQSLTSFDLPVTMGITVFVTVCVIVINLIVDLLYAVIDPRIRLA